MTMKEALAEIERKHPGIVWAINDRKKSKYFAFNSIQHAYWYYTWDRIDCLLDWQVNLIAQDDKWQLL